MIDVAGQHLKLSGQVDADRVASLAAQVNERFESMQRATRNGVPSTVLALVALDLADELTAAQRKVEEVREEARRTVQAAEQRAREVEQMARRAVADAIAEIDRTLSLDDAQTRAGSSAEQRGAARDGRGRDRERVAGRRSAIAERYAQTRSPKSALPTRTSVAPHATATSRSCVMPMESSGSSPAPPCSSRSRASASKYGRAPSGSSVCGGTVIRPRSTSVRASRRTAASTAASVARLAPGLLRLTPHVHLHEHRERFDRALAQLARQLRRVDRVHEARARGHLARLVGLQVPDRVPHDALEVCERRVLLDELLHVVLAEVPLPRFVRRAHHRSGLRLRHGHQLHRARVAPRRDGRPLDARAREVLAHERVRVFARALAAVHEGNTTAGSRRSPRGAAALR